MEELLSATEASAQGGTANGIKKQKPKRKFNRTYLFCWIGAGIPLLGFLLFSGFPLVVSIMAMFSDMEYNQLDTMTWNNFAHFARMFTDAKLLQSLKVTVVLACAQFVSLAIALVIAGFLSQNVKGTRLFQTLYFVPYICSTVAVSVMWNSIFGVEGVINGIFGTSTQWLNNMENPSTLTIAIFISIIWQAPGYGIVMYCSAFKAISPSLYEAADLDGANGIHKFWYITLPGIKSVTLFLLLAGLTNGLAVFEPVLILAPIQWTQVAGPDDIGLTVNYYIYIKGIMQKEMEYASVIGWVMFVVTFAITYPVIRARNKIAAEED